MMWFAILLNAAMCALNVGVYLWAGSPVSLAVAVFSGLVTICLAIRATTR